MCGPSDGGKLGLRKTDGFTVKHSAGNPRSWCGFGCSFLLALLFFLRLEDLAVYRTDPDIGSRTLIAVTANDDDVIKDLFAIAAKATRQNFPGYLAGSDLDRSIHRKNRASS